MKNEYLNTNNMNRRFKIKKAQYGNGSNDMDYMENMYENPMDSTPLPITAQGKDFSMGVLPGAVGSTIQPSAQPSAAIQSPSIGSKIGSQIGSFTPKVKSKDNTDYLKLINAGISGVTGFANMIQNNKLRNQERQQMLTAATPAYWDNMEGEGLNNIPMYTKYGGSTVSSSKAKEILKDGTAQGHKLSAKQKRYFGWIAGGKKQYGGVVDYFNKNGMKSSKEVRASVFNDIFGTKEKYTGSAEQNIRFLKKLQDGAMYYDDSVPFDSGSKKVNLGAVGAKGKSSDGKKLESGLIVDKRTGKSYVIKGGVPVEQHPAITGENVNANSNSYSIEELSKDPSKRSTPVGSYFLDPNNNIYGMPGFNMNPIDAFDMAKPDALGIAAHVTYPADKKRRDKLYNSKNPYGSYGCINMPDGSINCLNRDFPKGDTAVVVDSNMPAGKRFLSKHNIKQTGGCDDCDQKQTGGKVFKNQEEINLANEHAKKFAINRKLVSGQNTFVARNTGDPIPQYIDGRTGLPFITTPSRPAAVTVPSDLLLSDIKSYNDEFWYDDPHTGDMIPINPGVVLNLPQFKQPVLPGASSINGKFATRQTGGAVNPNVEAEEGEILEGYGGDIAKIADDAGTHEEGGVKVANVKRVLEDTSDKRKDKASKLLRMSPTEVETLFGFKPKSPVSHAKAFELAKKQYDGKHRKIKLENKVLNEKEHLDKISAKTAELNMKTEENLPNSEDMFDALFLHQENVKKMHNIQDDGKIAKCGGKYTMKAQTGWVDKGYGTDRRPKGNAFAMPYYNKADGLWYLVPRTGGIGTGNDIPTGKLAKMKTLDTAVVSTGNKGVNRPLVAADPGLTLAEQTYDGVNDMGQFPTVSNPNQGIGTGVNATTNSQFKQQPSNKFNEPTYWDDIAPAALGLVDSLNRDPEIYNSQEFNQLNYKLLNPESALNANQADYNAAVGQLDELGNGVGNAAIAGLQAGKYEANAKVIGTYENQNTQLKNNEISYNTNVRDRQSAADSKTRGDYFRNVQLSKEAQRQQRLKSTEDISRLVALKRRQNKSGNLILKLSPAFDQNGEYNGYQYMPVLPGEMGNTGTTSRVVTTSTGKKYRVIMDSTGQEISKIAI